MSDKEVARNWSHNTSSFEPLAVSGPGFLVIGKGFVTVSQQNIFKPATPAKKPTINRENTGLG